MEKTTRLKHKFLELDINPKYVNMILQKVRIEVYKNTTYPDKEILHNIMFLKLMQLGDKEFFTSLINKEFKNKDGISMSDVFNKPEFELVPHKFAKELREISIRSEVKLEFEHVEFYCKNCGHDKAVYEEKQIRSIDEPKTSFYTCLHCKKVTKI